MKMSENVVNYANGEVYSRHTFLYTAFYCRECKRVFTSPIQTTRSIDATQKL